MRLQASLAKKDMRIISSQKIKDKAPTGRRLLLNSIIRTEALTPGLAPTQRLGEGKY